MVAVGKPDDGEHAQMRVAEPRLKAAGQRLIGQQRVEIHRHLGHADALALGRDAGMQIGQRLRVIEPAASGMKPSTSCSTRSVRSTKPRRTSRASTPSSRSRPS